MKNHFFAIIIVLVCAIISLVITNLFVPFFGMALQSDTLTTYWLLIADSAITYPTIGLVTLAGGFHFLHTKRYQSLIFIVFSLLMMKGIATINEHFLKENLAIPRPSISALEARGLLNAKDFYLTNATKEDRRTALMEILATPNAKASVVDIPNSLLEHWVHETGYSMPSGHAQNAFLLATLLSLTLLSIYRDKTWLTAPFFVWATLVAASRMALHVHTMEDVIMGAVSGVMWGIIVWIINRKLKLI
ncbi:phosphatase PAP2 family protein [Limibacter armeniacum]|uniref:phosphatase PAP2 family protein n=1 Tax=Limibacter armeniacum TaxID=466084 RepID=UPI002FE62401